MPSESAAPRRRGRKNSEESAAARLVYRLWSLSSNSFGLEDRKVVASLLLDHVAVAAAGSRAASSQVVRAALESTTRGALGAVPIIGTGMSLQPLDAAFANAAAAHSIEMDDTHSAASIHPGVVIFPTALSCAAMLGSTADTFVLGVVRGYEAMCRIGRAAGPENLYRRHLHPTSVVGHFGAAIAAASIIGLSEERAISAVGVAATLTAGTMQFLEDGSWTKRLNPGNAARNGIFSALLAERDFVAPRDGLGGIGGFLAMVGRRRQRGLLEQTGTAPLEINATSLKPHACCRYNQGPIDAVLALRTRHVIDVTDVASIEVGLLSVAMDIVWRPIEAKRHPASVVEAQFSLPFSIAVALADGMAGPRQFSEARIDDPILNRLMQRVTCVKDPQLDAVYPERWPAWVRITDKAGRIFEEHVASPSGDLSAGQGRIDVRGKLDMLTSDIWSPAEQEELCQAVDEVAHDRSFPRLLAALGSRN